MKKYTLLSLALTLSLFSPGSRLVFAEELNPDTSTIEMAQAVDSPYVDSSSDPDQSVSEVTSSDSNSNQSLFEGTSSSQSSQIDYHVSGEVPAIAQPTDMTCWATVATMMASWHDQTSHSIQKVMDRAGQTYRQKFDKNQGLAGSEKPKFVAALRMREEAPQSYTVEGLLSLLQSHGPLWVTTAEDAGIHARIVTGMSGDGTVDGTNLQVIDPADGSRHQESFRSFMQKFEKVAYGDINKGEELRLQVVHF